MSTPESEISSGVPSGAPDTGMESVADAPVSNQSDAIAGQSPEPEGGAAAPAFAIPQDNSDLEGQQHLQHVESLIQTRDAYRQLESDYHGYAEQAAPYIEAYQYVEQQLGGLHTAAQSVDLVQGLFTPEVDEQGAPRLDAMGVPVTNTQGFVDRLASQNWSTVTDLTARLLQLPAEGGEPLLAHVVRNFLGLDPTKLELYQSIQSPQDAARMGLLQIDPQELEDIPDQYQNTYARLNLEQRVMIQEVASDASRAQLLENFRQHHQWEDFYQSQQTEIERQRDARAQQFAQTVEARGEESSQALWTTHASALANELGQIQWSTDPNQSAQVQNLLLSATQTFVQNDPSVAPLLQTCDMLVRQSHRYAARGDTLQANQARIRAANLGTQIFGRARQFALGAVQTLQSFSGMAASSQANGTSRPVVNARGQGGMEGNGQKWQMPQGVNFGSKEYIDALMKHAGR